MVLCGGYGASVWWSVDVCGGVLGVGCGVWSVEYGVWSVVVVVVFGASNPC